MNTTTTRPAADTAANEREFGRWMSHASSILTREQSTQVQSDMVAAGLVTWDRVAEATDMIRAACKAAGTIVRYTDDASDTVEGLYRGVTDSDKVRIVTDDGREQRMATRYLSGNDCTFDLQVVA